MMIGWSFLIPVSESVRTRSRSWKAMGTHLSLTRRSRGQAVEFPRRTDCRHVRRFFRRFMPSLLRRFLRWNSMVLGRPSRITSRPDLHHLTEPFRSHEQTMCLQSPLSTCYA